MSRTILSEIRRLVAEQPDLAAYNFVDDKLNVCQSMTRKQLWVASRNVAYTMSTKYGVVKGDRVIICYPFGIEFLVGFFACMQLGAICVSVYPPNPAKLSSTLPIFAHFVEDSGTKVVLTTASFKKMQFITQSTGKKWPKGLKWIATDTLDANRECYPAHWDGFHDPRTAEQCREPAFIQYTSGSTSKPKGVVISHEAIMNQVVIMENVGEDLEPPVARDARIGSWCPQYHDMGLIATYLFPIVTGRSFFNISPLVFIQKPLIFMGLIEKFNISVTAAAPFSISLCLARAQAANRKFDCSCLRIMCCGGEGMRVSDKEAALLKPYFNIDFFKVVNNMYGSAENTLFAIGSVPLRGVDRAWSCGSVIHSRRRHLLDIRIVDQDTLQEVPCGVAGEIWMSSPSVATGYWQRPEATAQTFGFTLAGRTGKFFRSGDKGYVDADGNLFVVGRIKDVIIIQGKNYAPIDIESVVEETFPDMLRPSCSVAFQANASEGDDSTAVLVCEVRNRSIAKLKAMDVDQFVVKVRSIGSSATGAAISDVVLVPQGKVPKTTSGKVQRSRTKDQYYDGSLPTIASVLGIEGSAMGDIERAHALQGATSMDDIFAILDVDMDKSLSENGLSSMALVEVQNAINDQLKLEIDYGDLSNLPCNQLAAMSKKNTKTQETSIHLPAPTAESPARDPGTLPSIWWKLKTLFLQFGVLTVLFGAIVSATLPSVAFVDHLADYTSDWWVVNGRAGPAMVVAIVLWMASYSLICVALKWVLLFDMRRNYGNVTIQQHWSFAFARWWTVERLMAVWEGFVGLFVMDTILMNIMYKLLGAKIAIDVRIKAPIRDWDFVSVGEGSTIEGSLIARLFRDGAVHFAPIRIGSNTTVGGGSVVQPGCRVAEATLIQPKSMLKPFTVIEEPNTVWSGVPATRVPDASAGMNMNPRGRCLWALGTLGRLMVPVVFAVASTAALTAASVLIPPPKPNAHFETWTADSMYIMYSYMAVFAFTGVQMLTLSVLLKWSFVSPYLTDGIATKTQALFFPFVDKNVLVPLYFRLFGMRFGSLQSGMVLGGFAVAPSLAHRVTVGKNAFLAHTEFCPTSKEEAYASTVWEWVLSAGKRKSPWSVPRSAPGSITIPDGFQALNKARIEAGVKIESGAVGLAAMSRATPQTVLPAGMMVAGNPATVRLKSDHNADSMSTFEWLKVMFTHCSLVATNLAGYSFCVFVAGETARSLPVYGVPSIGVYERVVMVTLLLVAMIPGLLASYIITMRWLLLGPNSSQGEYNSASVRGYVTVNVQVGYGLLYVNYHVLFGGLFLMNLMWKLSGVQIPLLSAFVNQGAWVDPTDGSRMVVKHNTVLDAFCTASAHQAHSGAFKKLTLVMEPGSVLHPLAMVQAGSLSAGTQMGPMSIHLKPTHTAGEYWLGCPARKVNVVDKHWDHHHDGPTTVGQWQHDVKEEVAITIDDSSVEQSPIDRVDSLLLVV